MFIDAMGLILADTEGSRMRELTAHRAMAAVPFAGRYRIIDFMLSNMVNSGVVNVGVLTSNKYRSLMDHLGNGAAWDLSRKKNGLFVLPPYITTETRQGEYNAYDGITGILNYLRANSFKYIIIGESNVVLNTTFNSMVEEHKKSEADVTIMFSRGQVKDDVRTVFLDLSENNRVNNIYINHEEQITDNMSLNIYVLEREFLIGLIEQSLSKGDRIITFDRFFQKSKGLKIHGYEYKGTALKINSVQNYFSATMELLKDNVKKEIFMGEQRVFTKVKDEAPAFYSSESKVTESLISDGCRIYGTVDKSLFFRNVTISPKARVRNCILLENVHISEGCLLENVIIDKNSILRPGIKLIGQPEYPMLIGKGAVV